MEDVLCSLWQDAGTSRQDSRPAKGSKGLLWHQMRLCNQVPWRRRRRRLLWLIKTLRCTSCMAPRESKCKKSKTNRIQGFLLTAYIGWMLNQTSGAMLQPRLEIFMQLDIPLSNLSWCCQAGLLVKDIRLRIICWLLALKKRTHETFPVTRNADGKIEEMFHSSLWGPSTSQYRCIWLVILAV